LHFHLPCNVSKKECICQFFFLEFIVKKGTRTCIWNNFAQTVRLLH
jgi:hypothetical protein